MCAVCPAIECDPASYAQFSPGVQYLRRHRVVVTGIGMVTPVGNDAQTTFQGVVEGRSGIGPITRYDTTSSPVKVAGEVKDFDPATTGVDAKALRRMDLYTQYALAAAREALAHSGLDLTQVDPELVGVSIGTGMGGSPMIEAAVRSAAEKDAAGTPRRVSPYLIPAVTGNQAAGQVSISHGAKGPVFCVNTACASGANSIGEAARIIERGDAVVMFAGGTEATISPVAVDGFASMTALSKRNDSTASRPWDKQADGFVMSEGAAVLILESEESARARGAKILAVVSGYGRTGDAYHPTAPGDGAARAMKLALKDAQLPPSAVGYINAHGTSTPLGDANELNAIRTVFGTQAQKVPISSSKSTLGHTLGAAGAIEAAITIQALNAEVLPPTANLVEPVDAAAGFNLIPGTAIRMPGVNHVMSNSFGFGGVNTSLIFSRP